MRKKESDYLSGKKLKETRLPKPKIVRRPIGEIKGDVLPDVARIIKEHNENKTKEWGRQWGEILLKPKTQRDLLFGAFVDLEETALRVQAILMRKKINYQFLKIYLKNIQEHISKINTVLEEI